MTLPSTPRDMPQVCTLDRQSELQCLFQLLLLVRAWYIKCFVCNFGTRTKLFCQSGRKVIKVNGFHGTCWLFFILLTSSPFIDVDVRYLLIFLLKLFLNAANHRIVQRLSQKSTLLCSSPCHNSFHLGTINTLFKPKKKEKKTKKTAPLTLIESVPLPQDLFRRSNVANTM